MKSITEFQKDLLRDFPEYLPERMVGSEITTQTISKNGKDMTGIIVKMGQVSPVLYVEKLYDQYSNGQSYEEVLEGITRTLENVVPPSVDSVVEKLKNWEENAQLLAVPVDHPKAQKFKAAQIVGDIAAVPCCVVSSDSEGFGLVTYDDLLCSQFDIDEQTLIESAKANMAKDVSLKTLRDMVAGMMPPEMEGFLPPPTDMELNTFVLTNTRGQQGAAAIFSQEIMDKICAEHSALKDGCVILPSSIHEVILMPMSVADPAELATMVQNINGDVVSAEEQLSNNIYAYYPGIGLEPIDVGRSR